MLPRVFKFLGIAVIVVITAAWLFNLIAAPTYLYSVTRSVPSRTAGLILATGQLNQYPMSRECYTYVFIHPSEVTLDTRKIQWDYLVAQFSCDGEISASWLSASAVEVTATRVRNGSLPYKLVTKPNDKSGAIRVSYRTGA